MRTKFILLSLLITNCFFIKGQDSNTTDISDWNTLRKSGFYESQAASTANVPNKDVDLFWGINIAHRPNATATHIPYHWGGQILLGINRFNQPPQMYIRSTNEQGNGIWAKVIHDKGSHNIDGALSAKTINASDLSGNTFKSILGRLSEGNNEGEGTFLGVKGYATYPDAAKSFSIEHKFYGQLNNSINFHRGSTKTGGYIGFGVDNGREVAKIHSKGLDVVGTINAKEVKIDEALNAKTLNALDLSGNTFKSILGRLTEGNNEGEGTFLGVKGYAAYPSSVKSFSIEHKFYGQLNNSINFYRGGSKTGGYIGFGVDNGREIAKIHSSGLDVAGTINAREVKIEITAGADHVFDPEYSLKPLSEVNNFIQQNKHLPEIPNEKEMQENGLNINEFQIKLLQKIEELTLYVIQQDKTIENLNAKIEELATEIKQFD